MSLDGRVALVTGANHGIGAATAVELARLGADVAVTYLRQSPAPDPDPGTPPEYGVMRAQDGSETVAAIQALGRRALAIEADLADPATPGRLLDTAEHRLGPVSILINNASGWRQDTFSSAAGSTDEMGRRMEPVTAETFDSQFLVDARGAALLIAELSRRVRSSGSRWGRVVGLTSGGPHGFPSEVSYGAAKAALENYTLSAATELAADGITCNLVHPPITDTGWVTDAVRQVAARHHSHVAPPEDVATVIGWLCTDAAGLVTGNIIRLR